MENNLNPLNREQTEIVKLASIEKQKKLIGQIQLHRGHTLFEVNIKTGEIKEAVYEEKLVEWRSDGKVIKKKSITIDKNCIYLGALNKKNLIKKLKK